MLGAEAVLALCWSKYSDWRHFKESLFLDELKLGAKPKLLVLKTLALLESSEARHCLGFCAATAGEDSECSLSFRRKLPRQVAQHIDIRGLVPLN